jgi:hypothetical protein
MSGQSAWSLRVVAELEGRVTILDRDHTPVAFLGDNPLKTPWAKYELDPHDIKTGIFSAAHGCFIDSNGDIFISEFLLGTRPAESRSSPKSDSEP